MPIRSAATAHRTTAERPPTGGTRSHDAGAIRPEALPPPAPQPPPPVRLEDVSGGRLLASDIRTAFILANEARYRALERLFGIERGQANLLTAVAVLTLADAAHDRFEKILRAPGAPSAGDIALGAAIWQEVVQSVAGPASRDTPLFGTLVTLAVLGGAVGPVLARSRHGASSASRRVHAAFRHRYGYLIARHRRRR